ncbi:MAG: DNA-processing protein DprA [Aggregatilineales bacterium]
MITERLAAVALALTEGVGWQTASRLLSVFGTPQDVLTAAPEQLAPLRGVSVQVKHNLANLEVPRLLEKLAHWQAQGIRYSLWYEADYPPSFARLESRPLIVFWSGSALPEPARCIAIVGTRQPSQSTLHQTAKWSAYLAERGWGIISGLARGVDVVAHRAAVNARSYSGAVLGSGILSIYPPEHAVLAAQLQQNGFLLSEYAPDQLVRPDWLVLRNRLIAALCRAVLVVEAPAESGALHTARFAHRQGVPVFALPNSAGNLALLADYARPLPQSPDAFLETLQCLPYPPEPLQPSAQPRSLFEEE